MSTLRRSLAGLVLFGASVALAGAVLWGVTRAPGCVAPARLPALDAELNEMHGAHARHLDALAAEAAAEGLPPAKLEERVKAASRRHRADVRALFARHGRTPPPWARAD